MRIVLVCLATSFVSIMLATIAEARDALTRATATAYLQGDYGFATRKSELVAQNDVGAGLRYSLGFHAGDQKIVGVILQTETNTTAFELNGATLSTTSQDFIVRTRFKNFFFGAILANAAVAATFAEGEETEAIDAVASGYGAHFATVFDIGRDNAFFLTSNYATYGETREREDVDYKLVSRLDVDVGAQFYVTRDLLDVNFGYRYRTEAMSLAGAAASELITTTYLGLRLNFMF